jgi:hypothetical protein
MYEMTKVFCISGSNPLKGISGLTMYSSNDEDPYITLKNDVSRVS